MEILNDPKYIVCPKCCSHLRYMPDDIKRTKDIKPFVREEYLGNVHRWTWDTGLFDLLYVDTIKCPCCGKSIVVNQWIQDKEATKEVAEKFIGFAIQKYI